MKVLALVILSVVAGTGNAFWDNATDFVGGAYDGAKEMGKAYNDMREANWKNSDKYFHARGNYDAAQHGPGGKWAAEKISDAREWVDMNIKGDSKADSDADQEANRHGRNGGDPNKYRPPGLPTKY
ncbi:serum amyloid A-5 protein-like [Dreissena polymorpha]|uniref:serum amyloid A-5 protein-like n=1 Tax=Dreissena polymorpha TaxID=45954 RepID=UPI002263E7FD|nr:serum amyloid A-5 protein-like [Dreissena polymorpha]XP_052250025.1 serum amyloid A-5 protein-like [Dreissena polymorpha]